MRCRNRVEGRFLLVDVRCGLSDILVSRPFGEGEMALLFPIHMRPSGATAAAGRPT